MKQFVSHGIQTVSGWEDEIDELVDRAIEIANAHPGETVKVVCYSEMFPTIVSLSDTSDPQLIKDRLHLP